MNVKIEDWEICVDIEGTKSFYTSFPYKNDEMFALNYIEACSYCEPEILTFFDQLGIDILKPGALYYLPIEGDCIMYSGSYYVKGTVIAGELDEWDVVVDPFCFSLTDGQYDTPSELVGDVIEISFEAVLPWLLFEPIPAI